MICQSKCGTTSLRNAAFAIAIIDVILFSGILVVFMLGSSLMISFKFTGNAENVTRVLDEITDDVFGSRNVTYSHRQSKDVIEDIGVFLIIKFLVIADFAASCIFVDGVRKWNSRKCQIWFDIRIVTVIIFMIVTVINLVNGPVWYRSIPDVLITIYRLIGIFVGYMFLQELYSVGNLCKYCRKNINNAQQRPSIIDLSDKRAEVKRELREMPIVIITGPPDDSAFTAAESEISSFYLKRKNSMEISNNVLPEFKLGQSSASSSSSSSLT